MSYKANESYIPTQNTLKIIFVLMKKQILVFSFYVRCLNQ